MRSVRLLPRPPFDFSLSAAIFSRGDPRFRQFSGGIFRHAMAIGGLPLLLEVRSTGTTGAPELTVATRSDRPIPAGIRNEAEAIVSRIFSTGDDLAPFYHAMAPDPVMTDLTRQMYGLRAPSTPTVFEALVDSVIEQQISLKAAQSVEYRLIAALGPSLSVDGSLFYCYPGAEVLAGTTDATFRSCGLTLRKGEYLRGIAQQVLAGKLDPESFRAYPETESIIAELVKCRGIGRWTAELTILRGLHRPDAFPADDVGVRRFISRYYLGGEKIAATDARTFAERWGPWKGFAAYYLEVADLLGITPGKTS
jgi:DNA-3-methyladenine glycosylase II